MPRSTQHLLGVVFAILGCFAFAAAAMADGVCPDVDDCDEYKAWKAYFDCVLGGGENCQPPAAKIDGLPTDFAIDPGHPATYPADFVAEIEFEVLPIDPSTGAPLPGLFVGGEIAVADATAMVEQNDFAPAWASLGPMIPSSADGALTGFAWTIAGPGKPYLVRFALTDAAGGVHHLFTAMVPVEPGCPADLDGDGAMTSADLNILLAAFGASPSGDIDGDADTDSADLNLLLAEFGEPCP